MKTILAIALAFGLVGCVDETTPEGIDGIEEEFDDLGPDTHKSDIDETEPGEAPLPFTDQAQAELTTDGIDPIDPREATVTDPTREVARPLVELERPLESRTPVQGVLVETGRKPLESRTPAPRL